jgi:hypothetical protein
MTEMPRNKEKILRLELLRSSLDHLLIKIGDKRKQVITTIIEGYVNQNDYFDGEGFDRFVEERGLRSIEGLDEQIINRIKERIENYYRRSREKKGINFRDRLDTPESVRAYLYLTLPENQRGPFQADFERLLTQKEDFFFRLWPPKISISFRDLFKEGEIRGGLWGPGEFFREVKDYIKDLQKGKNRITLYFSEDLLPDELKGKKEDELEALGIKKAEDGNYELYITPDKLQDILFDLVERSLSVAEQETEIGRKLTKIKELFKEARQNLKSVPEAPLILASSASLIEGLESRYRGGLREGMSEEESKKLLEAANRLEEFLRRMAEGSKDKKGIKGLLAKAKEWLKANGGTILSAIGLWGLAVGWFLPLWLISKMYDEIEKGSLVGGR